MQEHTLYIPNKCLVHRRGEGSIGAALHREEEEEGYEGGEHQQHLSAGAIKTVPLHTHTHTHVWNIIRELRMLWGRSYSEAQQKYQVCSSSTGTKGRASESG